MLPVWLRLRLAVRGRRLLRGVGCLWPGQAIAGNMALLSTNVACARVNPLGSGWRTATGTGLCFGGRSSQLLLSICAVNAHGQLTDLLHLLSWRLPSFCKLRRYAPNRRNTAMCSGWFNRDLRVCMRWERLAIVLPGLAMKWVNSSSRELDRSGYSSSMCCQKRIYRASIFSERRGLVRPLRFIVSHAPVCQRSIPYNFLPLIVG
jgi:hypothetical protein